ncbi:MAG: hypothetical protein BJ554DRAFT_7811, partial [Olpidium bornovanus]
KNRVGKGPWQECRLRCGEGRRGGDGEAVAPGDGRAPPAKASAAGTQHQTSNPRALGASESSIRARSARAFHGSRRRPRRVMPSRPPCPGPRPPAKLPFRQKKGKIRERTASAAVAGRPAFAPGTRTKKKKKKNATEGEVRAGRGNLRRREFRNASRRPAGPAAPAKLFRNGPSNRRGRPSALSESQPRVGSLGASEKKCGRVSRSEPRGIQKRPPDPPSLTAPIFQKKTNKPKNIQNQMVRAWFLPPTGVTRVRLPEVSTISQLERASAGSHIRGVKGPIGWNRGRRLFRLRGQTS